MALALLALALLPALHPCLQPVSRLHQTLGGQGFQLTVADGGAAVLTASATGEHLTTITSGFSSPGPEWNEFDTSPSARAGRPESGASPGADWSVTVDRSKAAVGVWTVIGRRPSFSVLRTYTLDPLPPSEARRILVNDTISTPPSSAWPLQAPPSSGNILGISVRHTATVATSPDEVDTAVVPGAYAGWQCDTHGNPSDTCGPNCFDRAAKRTNNGRPDVFANRSSTKSWSTVSGRSTAGMQSTFGIGLVALDDVFRVHAQTAQRAMATGPRMQSSVMHCNVTDPPTIELSDPNLALRRGGDLYVQEWAVYPFVAPAQQQQQQQQQQQNTEWDEEEMSATDFFAFVNAQRHDMGSDRITMQRTGFLGPGSSARSDLSVYEGSGYDTCYNKSLSNPNAEPKPRATSKTCWETWDPQTFLDFIEKQAGPGGIVHISNGDMLYDKPGGCGQITIDGNRFVDSAQRPADFDVYFAQVVNQTRKANALLPPTAPKHKVVLYTDNFASTGVNDSTLFADSLVKLRDGTQGAYENCTKPGDNASHVQLLSFYADGTNSFSRLLREYYELALSMGADGLFHDEFPASNYHYTYHSPWDNRTAWLSDETLAVEEGPLPASLILLTQEHELSLARLLDSRGAVMVMNGAPHTRSWFKNALSATHPTINENENGCMWRANHVQLFTPIMLTRYGGNKHDPDPRYNYTTECPGPSASERKICFSDLCRCFNDHLDFGTLSMSYGALWHNGSDNSTVGQENVYGHMMPTTAIEIGEGFVLGRERTVTKRSGVYRPPSFPGTFDFNIDDANISTTIYRYTHCLLSETKRTSVGTLSGVELELAPTEVAVIVWGE